MSRDALVDGVAVPKYSVRFLGTNVLQESKKWKRTMFGMAKAMSLRKQIQLKLSVQTTLFSHLLLGYRLWRVSPLTKEKTLSTVFSCH